MKNVASLFSAMYLAVEQAAALSFTLTGETRG